MAKKNQFSNPPPGHRSLHKAFFLSFLVRTVEITVDNTGYIAAKSFVPKFFIIIFKLKNYGTKKGGMSDQLQF